MAGLVSHTQNVSIEAPKKTIHGTLNVYHMFSPLLMDRITQAIGQELPTLTRYAQKFPK
ncbi:MAG: hypothetical protein ACK5PQ_04945 [Alphaproteobacteria bacterium]